jgi:hypothetical protein
MRLAAIDEQEIEIPVPTRNEAVKTGSNEGRQLHGPLLG